MKKSSLIVGAASCAAVSLSLLTPTAVMADALVGFNTVTVNNTDGNNIFLADLTYDSTVYSADVFLYGATERYYDTTNATTLLWPEGDGVPADIAVIGGTSNPKTGDVGSHADNNDWTLGSGTGYMSSLDGIPYQTTIFAFPVDRIFVFERGANDNGTVNPILLDDNLGAPLTITYSIVGSYTGQNVGGYVIESDVLIKGIQINAPGHDSLTVLALPEPTSLSLLGLGLGGLLLARRRNR